MVLDSATAPNILVPGHYGLLQPLTRKRFIVSCCLVMIIRFCLFIASFLSKNKRIIPLNHIQIHGIINGIFEYDLPLMIPFTGETDCWLFRLSTMSTIVIYSIAYLDKKKRNKH